MEVRNWVECSGRLRWSSRQHSLARGEVLNPIQRSESNRRRNDTKTRPKACNFSCHSLSQSLLI